MKSRLQLRANQFGVLGVGGVVPDDYRRLSNLEGAGQEMFHCFTKDAEVFLQNNNGVNIYGLNAGQLIPSEFSIPANSASFQVAIKSANEMEDGDPSMTIIVNGGTPCQVQFVDGPWSQLGYLNQNPPVCNNIKATGITQDSQYAYELSLTHQPS